MRANADPNDALLGFTAQRENTRGDTMEPRPLTPVTEDVQALTVALQECREELAVARGQVVDAAELLQDERRRHAHTRSEVENFTSALTAIFEYQRRAWSGPSSGWRRPLLRPGLAPVDQAEVDRLEVVATSPLFDAAWYLRTNPDVLATGMDPALHFVRSGAFEGRAPGPEVDVDAFLDANPVARDGDFEPWIRLLTGAS